MSTCFSSVWSIARSGIAASHGNPMLNFVRDCQINFHEKIILFKLYFIIYAITVVPVFSPLPTSTQPTPATPSCNPYILSMSIGHTYVFSGYLTPFTFHLVSSSSHLPSNSCQSVPCICASVSVLLVSLLCSSGST